MHSYIIRNGFMLVILLGNALIDMFSKCSDIEDARQVFDKFSSRNQGKS
jgi:pentatricopeptide repeat protein